MKQKDVFNKIGGILKELNEQYQYLETNEGDLNELEIELFVANAHFLKDHAEILNKLVIRGTGAKATAAKAEPVVVKPDRVVVIQEAPVVKPEAPPVKQEAIVTKKEDKEKYFEPVVHQLKHADRASEANSNAKNTKVDALQEEQPSPKIDLEAAHAKDIFSFIRETPETAKPGIALNEAASIADKEIVVPGEKAAAVAAGEAKPDAVKEDEINPVNTEEAATITKDKDAKKTEEADEVKMLTVNQKISSQLEQKTKLPGAKPISDLKLAITMNDKMLYVKELFNGYNLAYSEAIEILNRFNTFEEASRFLKTNYVTKNKWDSKPATTEKFYALLQRRYPPVL
jgi:hypothetical protein